MATTTRRDDRRPGALSRERIVAVAIDILDAEGEGALTFRALAARLATGAGAIYWYIPNENDLLAAATAEVIADVVTGVDVDADPLSAIRALALGIFDAIDAHPWVGTQLAQERWPSALLPIVEHLGEQLQALGVTDTAQFDCATALLNFILGLAGQYAAAARLVPRGTDRAAYLTAMAAGWMQLDPGEYPFLHQVASQLSTHDDRKQFLAGIDLILTGIEAVR